MRCLWGRWVVIAIALGITGVWVVGSLLTHATPSTITAPAPPAQSVRIDSTSGVSLAGTYWPAQQTNSPALLLLHGNGSNRGSMSQLAAWLNAHGYAVLTIDFRGHGKSTETSKSFGLFEAEDAQSALGWLREKNPKSPMGVVGFSLGGAASLIGKDGPLNIDALVLIGVYPDIRHAIYNRLAIRLGHWPAALTEPLLSYQSIPRFGVVPSAIAPISALPRVKAPVLIVGGSNDRNTPPQETQTMYEAVKSDKALINLPGLSHNDLGNKLPDLFKDDLLVFLDRHLRE